MLIRIKRGLDIRIDGAPVQSIEPGPAIRSVAVLGADYVALKPKVLVSAGDFVRAGQALLSDRNDADLVVTAPGSGRVVSINRGHRRALESVVIELDGSEPGEAQFECHKADGLARLDRRLVTGRLLASGLWTSFRTRPYSRIPASHDVPEAIFVTAIDTRPHAPDPEVVIASDAPALHAGLDVIGRLTDGKVHVCSQAGSELRIRETDQRRHAHFDGPHPAGLPGTHIHFLHPVGHDCSVWHIGYQDVIAIGRLFLTGRQNSSRVVALSGPPLRRPRLVRTRIGASLQDLAGPADGCRIVSGSVLDGRMASGNLAFLGRYHLQASLIPQARDRRLLGWLRRGDATTTARRGEPCAMIPCEAFDAVMPLDLLPGPLLKSLLVGDAREAARLGCLELDEEDLALVGWSCPAKIDYAAALRSTLDAIWKER